MPWRNVTAAQALLHGSETHRGRVRAGKQVTRHRHARLLVAAPPAELSFNNEHDETSSAHTETGVREVGDERIHNQLQSCAPACSSSNRENREREGERGRESELARERQLENSAGAHFFFYADGLIVTNHANDERARDRAMQRRPGPHSCRLSEDCTGTSLCGFGVDVDMSQFDQSRRHLARSCT